MTDELVGYFGFGSLVNQATLRTNYIDAIPTRLAGWRRHWQGRSHNADDHGALLSIHPHEKGELFGMLVVDHLENLPLVDERESGYSRVEINTDVLKLSFEGHKLHTVADLPAHLYVYVAKTPEVEGTHLPLLQSYTDAVMQGYLREYGQFGLSHFIETTIGFNRAIVRDRQHPRYARAVDLPAVQADLFDGILRDAGVCFESWQPQPV